ncbi:POMT2 [Branchiostoma lanceolatum]|uniref:Protein O-mannosyl-transferase 2 n=1 Tax=Branchiostoma lanceolatum TaxID=7740 RepID=A0A8J9ZU23_BRALA|nr:POMT2 [Branchiostoma lanceolatum]
MGRGKQQNGPTQTQTVAANGRDKTGTKARHQDGGKPEHLGLHAWGVFAAIVALTLGTRFYKLEEPDHICWDETHFGKMGSYYINRTFFFDVHPPLGKMLIGLSGHLTGYDGTFPFEKPGDNYGETKYIGMRTFCVSLGSTVVPLAFLTVWELTWSLPAASVAAALLLFDTGCLTLSQYILLDPIMLCFIMGAVFCQSKFDSLKNRPFSMWWWVWMCGAGCFIALAFSVKFVGLFIILWVGLKTVSDLWDLLGDLTLPLMVIFKHFLARTMCLIVLPAAIYITCFAVHFHTLYKSGSGDGFMSSAFQSTLEGNKLYQAIMPEDIAYGSTITLKNYRPAGGLLHSHWHLYPEGLGAQQQQITAYTHKDDNNYWIIKRYDRNPIPEDPIQFVKNGDLVRLEHVATRRNLHTHQEPAPITKRHFQVTGYGQNGTGDINDIWKVEVVGGTEKSRIKTVRSKVRFIHYMTGCALHSHSKTLPKWGWEQLEVTCNPFTRDKNNLWNVEDHINNQLPNGTFAVYQPSFLGKLLESHAVMVQGNSGLKAKEGEVTSQPWQWPLNYRGQRFSGINATDYKVYLLGNPVIWWGNLALLAGAMLVFLVEALRTQRGFVDPPQLAEKKSGTLSAARWMAAGWALHYLPFYFMGRVLYFHHYFPAMLFQSMLTAIMYDYFLQIVEHKAQPKVYRRIHQWGTAFVFIILLYSFYLFHPLSYGMFGPLADNETSPMYGLKWMESWEI